MLSKVAKAVFLILLFTVAAVVAPALTAELDLSSAEQSPALIHGGAEAPAPPSERFVEPQRPRCFEFGTVDQYGDCVGAPRDPCPC